LKSSTYVVAQVEDTSGAVSGHISLIAATAAAADVVIWM
jgi:chemotaxis protein CheY-P-specific phosphatase CheC